MSLRASRIAFAVAVCAATVACSLTTDLGGFSLPDPSETGDVEGSSADAPVTPLPAVVEAGPRCKPQAVIDAPLTSTLDTWSTRAHNQTGYPKVEPFFAMPAAVLLPFVDTTPVLIDAGNPDAAPTYYSRPERTGAIGGIWQITPVALYAFDVDLEIYVKCTKAGSCADGVAFAWLDTTSPAVLTNSNAGHMYGVPKSVAGGAVLLDDYTNDSTDTSDPPAPSLQIVKIDATKDLGHYPWVVAWQAAAFLGGWHELRVSVRGDAVSARLDANEPISAKVPALVRGLVGISAGTGGLTDAVAVRNVKGSFYDCTP